MKGKYLYAIIKNVVVPFMAPKINKVDFHRLSAVISNVEYKDYHNLPKKKVIKELIEHQKTIEKIMESFDTILPVKFGTILKDENEVKSVLEKGYFFLLDMLRKMEDKIELDLVCFWNEKKAAQMAFQESKKIRDYYTSEVKSLDTSEVSPASSEVENKIALGKLIAQYLETKKKKLSNQILKVLKKEAVGSVSHVLTDVNMLLNEAFLVKRENEERFNHALNLLDSKFNELINFRLVGPLPPYSFATVVIDALDKEELEKAKKLLNLDGEISKESLKKIYDQLAFKLHPDHGGSPIEFELITQSYKLLRKYEEHGLIGVSLYKWEEKQTGCLSANKR